MRIVLARRESVGPWIKLASPLLAVALTLVSARDHLRADRA